MAAERLLTNQGQRILIHENVVVARYYPKDAGAFFYLMHDASGILCIEKDDLLWLCEKEN